MRQLNFVKKGKLEWHDVPEPKITGPDQALVHPLAVARCDLDLPVLRGQSLFRPPFPVGHEFVGQIVATSEDLTDAFSAGDRVVVPFQVSCGSCPRCLARLSLSCTTVPAGAHFGLGRPARDYGGALQDVVLVPYARTMLVSFDDSIDPVAIASISDNITEAWKLAGQYLKEQADRKVLVIGGLAASIGLYTAGLAKSMGAEVLYADSDRGRLEHAERLGLRVQHFDALPRSLGEFDIAADATGDIEGLRTALRSITPYGIVGSASIFWTNDAPIPYLDLYNNGARLDIGRVRSREWIPEVLDAMEKYRYRPEDVVTRVVGLDDAAEAWTTEETKLVVRLE
ncbi:MAG: alcohol dehydrogenase catalytic domain-containing protein [Spirochaetales bacterium]|nr:alcohol dehydrogenase catalytic domain-containing protein [Leptospiraceae bacterium]MCP5482986.1 alcohol dehydrogenase catalytic domain-containing protein [Spirochaetales bacterium]MCP5484835.1 alcohol dehydrogenase catalytic domain-containing protein [Spirochaetales bacterium]